MSDMNLIMENWNKYVDREPLNENFITWIQGIITDAAVDVNNMMHGETAPNLAGRMLSPQEIADLKGEELIEWLKNAYKAYDQEAATRNPQNFVGFGNTQNPSAVDIKPGHPNSMKRYISLAINHVRNDPEKISA